MKNFPPPLYYRLRSAGYDVEHIIILGQRGVKDLKFGASRQRGRCFPDWFNALQRFTMNAGNENLFDLLGSGHIIPWEVRKVR